MKLVRKRIKCGEEHVAFFILYETNKIKTEKKNRIKCFGFTPEYDIMKSVLEC